MSTDLEFYIKVRGPVNGTLHAVRTNLLQNLCFDDVKVSVTPAPTPRQASLSLASKSHRVNRQGVPLPDPSPTGEGESDRLPDMAHVDMFQLTPNYSVSDVAIPLEGGELTLEFRRTCGIRNQAAGSPVYATDEVLGLGWDTSLGSRILVSTQEGLILATVVDDLGNSYPYVHQGGVYWAPDTTHTFNNDALRCRLSGPLGGPLVFQRTYGTQLTYDLQIASVCSEGPDYYRLREVKDRNANTIEYVYTNSPLLATEIREVRTNFPRKITFQYNADNRLTKVTDPLGREIEYSYTGFGRLEQVRYPVVENPSGGTNQPTVSFTYFDEDHPLILRDEGGNVISAVDNRWVAPAT